MAIIKESDLSFEFNFCTLDDALWVQYELFFRWKNENLIRDDILKRSPSAWSGRSNGAFLANEFDRDSFLPVLNEVLASNESNYWVPTEPDVVIAFFPDFAIPFLPSTAKMIYEADSAKASRERQERRKKQNEGKLPDDNITMVAMVDCYNFKGCKAYEGQGPALVLTTTRRKWEKFRDELESEWQRFKIEQRLEERLGQQDSGSS